MVCFNFMPVVDWTRTNLKYELPNASRALRFEMADFVAYNVYLLQRENAEQDYGSEILERARKRFDVMTAEERVQLEQNIIAGLPGGQETYDLDGIRAAIAKFIDLGTEGMRHNLFAFLADIILWVAN